MLFNVIYLHRVITSVWSTRPIYIYIYIYMLFIYYLYQKIKLMDNMSDIQCINGWQVEGRYCVMK